VPPPKEEAKVKEEGAEPSKDAPKKGSKEEKELLKK
jgi:hypothetical protein